MKKLFGHKDISYFIQHHKIDDNEKMLSLSDCNKNTFKFHEALVQRFHFSLSLKSVTYDGHSF